MGDYSPLEAVLNAAGLLGGVTALLEVAERITGRKLTRGEATPSKWLREWFPRIVGAVSFLIVSVTFWRPVLAHPWKVLLLWFFVTIAVAIHSLFRAIGEGEGGLVAAVVISVFAVVGSAILGLAMALLSSVVLDIGPGGSFASAALSMLMFSVSLLLSIPRLYGPSRSELESERQEEPVRPLRGVEAQVLQALQNKNSAAAAPKIGSWIGKPMPVVEEAVDELYAMGLVDAFGSYKVHSTGWSGPTITVSRKGRRVMVERGLL